MAFLGDGRLLALSDITTGAGMALLVAFVVTVLCTPLVIRLANLRSAVDDPSRDGRRVHVKSIPRWGGLAIFAGILVGVLVACGVNPAPIGGFPVHIIAILFATATIVAMGAYDDVAEFSARRQAMILLLVGLMVAAVIPTRGGRVLLTEIPLPIFGATPTGRIEIPVLIAFPLTAFYIFVITKTMDTIDGVDGLAAGLAMIMAMAMAFATGMSGQGPATMLAASIAGAALGFLVWNFNPAKIFMGTGGSQGFGFLLACLSISGAMKAAPGIALFIPMIVFLVPLGDAIQVIIRRKKAGVPISQGDKRHVHHMLLSRGLSQRQTVLVLWAITALSCSVLVFWVRIRG